MSAPKSWWARHVVDRCESVLIAAIMLGLTLLLLLLISVSARA